MGFDYDANGPLLLNDGYCTYTAINNYRAVFAICNCAESTKFIAGLNVAVKMTILVNGQDGARGAYWSGDYGNLATLAPAAINFGNYASQVLACAAVPGIAGPDTFGPPTYYLSDGITVAAPDAGANCAVTNKVTILKAPGPYIVVGTEGPYWVIDIPAIRIDPTVIAAGATVSVQIDLYDPTVPTPICPTCVECLCTCVIDVAIVDCLGGVPPPPVTTKLLFPYFTDLTDASGWWNGIALTNPTAAAGTCTLTANEKSGNVATTTVDVPAGGLYVGWLQNLTWLNATGGLPVFVTAVCDYVGATGFAMLSDYNGESMGYLAK
jgi:hypothetical protein